MRKIDQSDIRDNGMPAAQRPPGIQFWNQKGRAILIGAFAALIPATVMALVTSHGKGTWPASWPTELDSYREQARTIEVATGTQETIYEIPFSSREEFERIWPVLLQIKSPRAPITFLAISNAPATPFERDILNHSRAEVRIHAPAGGGPYYPIPSFPELPASGTNREASEAAIKKQTDTIKQLIDSGSLKVLPAQPPWPSNIVSSNGELPLYVVAEKTNDILRWVPADLERDQKEGKFRGFYYRARVELELVVDGTIIEPARLKIPLDTPVQDKRH
jgi:hypothetical protein